MKRGRPRRFAPETESAIAAAYAAGESTKALAARYGVTPDTVAGIVRHQGGTLRRRGPEALPAWEIRVGRTKVAEVAARIDAGEPRRAIATELGVSINRIAEALSEYRRRLKYSHQVERGAA